ncbi:MAG: TetR/AcrR family transcriptional regulator [Magnetococcales bacterium]|nr:TetR/AcrR family transcriptional regulator [Magnetococcales bacterium]
MSRPLKNESKLSKEVLLKSALNIIDEEGEKALSFRALAKKHNVTPMAVSHHVGTRHKMISDLVSLIYQGVGDAPEKCKPIDSLRFILTRYCTRVLEHPNLAQCVLADQSLFSGQLVVLTNLIHSNITECGVDDDEVDIILNLIVDYTHGFAISATTGSSHNGDEVTLTINDYLHSLNWVLARLNPEGGGMTNNGIEKTREKSHTNSRPATKKGLAISS